MRWSPITPARVSRVGGALPRPCILRTQPGRRPRYRPSHVAAEEASVRSPPEGQPVVEERGGTARSRLRAPVGAASERACWACGGRTVAPHQYGPLALSLCRSCGLLFDLDRSEAELRSLYTDDYFFDSDRGAPLVDDEAARRYEARLRVDWVRTYRQTGDLLEIGSGGGYFLSEAQAATELAVCGVEPAEHIAAASASRFSVDVATGFVEQVALAADSYDLVCAWHVLEHLATPARALGRIHGALRDGGFLFVEVPNVAGVTATAQGAAWPPLDPRHHVAHYGPRSLRALLERSGFEVLELLSFPSSRYYSARQVLWPGMWPTLARQGWALRWPPRRAHPWKQDLLRAVARADGGDAPMPRQR